MGDRAAVRGNGRQGISIDGQPGLGSNSTSPLVAAEQFRAVEFAPRIVRNVAADDFIQGMHQRHCLVLRNEQRDDPVDRLVRIIQSAAGVT